MANVKVPPLLHKMSMASQKAWYKKHNMELPAYLTGKEGKSAAQAKKDVGDINKQKAKEKTALQKALETSPKQKELKKSSERVRQMAANALAFGGQRPGGDLTTSRGIVSYIRGGGYLKAGRLGEETIKEGKVNKAKKNEYVRQLGLKAMKAGKVDPARGHIPTRAGREELKKDLAETNGEYNRYGHIKPGSVDVDPTSSETPPKYTKRKPAQYKPKKMEESKMKDIATSKAETERLEAQKVLGGPVKAKPKMGPGKQPAGYRYVRNLARKALKAGHTVSESNTAEVDEMSYGKQLAQLFMAEKVKINEEVTEADRGEYDYEGDMAKSQLKSIITNAQRLHDLLAEDTNLPEWVQSKITLAEDYVLTASNYMQGELSEDVIQAEEAIFESSKKKEDDKEEMDKVEDDEEELDEAKMTDAQMKKREKIVKGMKPVSDWEKRYPGRGEEVMYATATKMAMKEEAEQVDEKYMGFKALKAKIAAKGGVRDPGAVAAAIGRKKYGKEKFQAAAAAGKKLGEEVEQIDEWNPWGDKDYRDDRNTYGGKIVSPEHKGGTQKFEYDASEDELEDPVKLRKRIRIGNPDLHSHQVSAIVDSEGYSTHVKVGKDVHEVHHDDNEFTPDPDLAPKPAKKMIGKMKEEVVTEAEGKVAVTPKEKDLAAHHGDKTRITYGDVIKARIKSAKEKAMKGNE